MLIAYYILKYISFIKRIVNYIYLYTHIHTLPFAYLRFDMFLTNNLKLSEAYGILSNPCCLYPNSSAEFLSRATMSGCMSSLVGIKIFSKIAPMPTSTGTYPLRTSSFSAFLFFNLR